MTWRSGSSFKDWSRLLRLAFWRMCQTLDEVCRAHILLTQESEHPCPQEHLHLWDAVTGLQPERGTCTKAKLQCCLGFSKCHVGAHGLEFQLEGSNYFWRAASQAKLLSCLTFCYRHFLGWLKETVLKLTLSVFTDC